MANKLTDITTTFHSFAPSQVLTHTQLNEFLDYFDEQDRLSRICLSGVGIVCGFNLIENKKRRTITITQGAGVTTDGDLIHLVKNERNKKGEITGKVLAERIEYTHFRKYNGDKTNYDPHFNKSNKPGEFKMIDLLEIVPEDEKKTKDKPLTASVLANKVVLFYLESYTEEQDSCVTIDCENQGLEEVSNLRVLLVDMANLKSIIRHDSLFNTYLSTRTFLESNPVYIPRVILNKNNTDTIHSLARQYQDGKLLATSVSNLRKGVETMFTSLGRTNELRLFEKYLQGFFDSKKVYLKAFQYRYDLLKDLIDTYNELKEVFLETYHDCCPDITAFPKHLLLGLVRGGSEFPVKFDPEELGVLLEDKKSGLASTKGGEIEIRHKFHKSPILVGPDEKNERFESVIKRMLSLVVAIDRVTLSAHLKEEIDITPSNVRVPLGKRAIPFYYRYSKSLIQNWDYDRRNYGRYNSILGYRLADAYKNSSNFPAVQEPLKYSIDPYNFFRIEGHQGHFYDDAFERLTELKAEHSLPFDIKVLGIGVDEFDDVLHEQYKCDFKDLGVLLKAWTEEQTCIAKEATGALSGFSTENPGTNINVYDFYNIPQKRVPEGPDVGPVKPVNTGAIGSVETVFGNENEFAKVDLSVIEKLLNDSSQVEDINKSKGEIQTMVGDFGDENLMKLATTHLEQIMNASGDEEVILSAKAELQKIALESRSEETASAMNLEVEKLVKAVETGETLRRAKEDLELWKLESEKEEKKANTGALTLTANAIPPAHPVLTTISGVENTLGYYINKAIKKSGGDYWSVLTMALNSIETRIGQKRALFESTARIPTQIIATCMSIVDLTPKSIKDLTRERLTAYNDKVKLLCDYVKRLRAVYQYYAEEDKKVISLQTRTMITVVINQLIDICCNSQKFKALLEEVERRKQEIIDRLDFSNFVENNPGLEHKAGVGPGETFVMVYINKTIRWKKTYRKSDGKLFRREEEELEKLSKLELIEWEKRKKAASLVDEELDFDYIERGTIIADFTLPYLCCSDCAPINFVLPEIPVSLIISASTYCIDNTNLELDLTVSPKDGVVSVEGEVPGVFIKDGKLSIDKSLFPSEKLGTTLKFRVNEKETDAELIVSRTPEVDFEFPDPGSNRIVRFTVKGDDFEGLTYHWDFGNGRTSSDKNPIHDFTELASSDFPQRSDYDVTLTVTSIGGICPAVVSHSISFEQVEVSIVDTVCINDGPVPFTIIPQGAFANIEGPGLNANKTHFDPLLTGPGTHTFTFEGEEMYVTVKDVIEVKGEIIPKLKEDTWVFYINADNVREYEWVATIDDNTKIESNERTLEIPVEVLEKLEPGKDAITIELLLSGCSRETAGLKWTIPGEDKPTATIDGFKFCNEDKREPVVIETKNFTTSTKLTGNGVNDKVKPPTFSPFGLEPGESHIFVDGQIADTVLIVAPPVAEISKIDSSETGLMATAAVDEKTDLSAIVWTFLDQDGNEVHESITGKATIKVDFANFLNEKWTEVTVVLTLKGDPCEDGVDKETIDRAKKITFSLDDTVYCFGDSNTYHFRFDPEQGDVKVSGSGVNQEKSTFSPKGLIPKKYTLSASNGETLEIEVVERSIGIKEFDSTETSFSTGAILPPGVPQKSITWTFEGVDSKVVMHPPITGVSDIDVNFSSFLVKEWTDVRVTLSALVEPCGVISASKIFSKEEPQEVEVSLRKYTYCKGDDETYNFIYEPNEPMKMTGEGVTESQLAFSPRDLDPGDHTFVAPNGKTVTITVVESGQLNEPVLNAKLGTVTLSYTAGDASNPVSASWKIGKEKLGDRPGSSDDSYVVQLKDLGFESGDTLLYELTLISEVCKVKTLSGTFSIPGGDEKSCENTMVAELTSIKDNAPSGSVMKGLLQAHPSMVVAGDLSARLESMLKTPSSVVSGTMNDSIVQDVGNVIKVIHQEVIVAKQRGDETNLNLLTRLYRMAVAIYATGFRCQNDFTFDNFSNGIKLNTTLRDHFDSTNSDSFITMEVIVFDASNSAPFTALINEKGTGKEPWSTIDFIIKSKAR